MESINCVNSIPKPVALTFATLTEHEWCQIVTAHTLNPDYSLWLKNPVLYGISSSLLKCLTSNTRQIEYETKLKVWEERGYSIASYFDCEYPSCLRFLTKPPRALFYQSKKTIRDIPPTSIAIVGSRKAELSTCLVAEQFAKSIVDSGGCVVSGLAAGIDAAAHRGALDAAEGRGTPTIAVLGFGFEHIYPKFNLALQNRILDEGGMLISEYEPSVAPYPINFLARNRIIAALSEGVVLLEAHAKSGSIATAQFAIDLNKEVLVIPGAYGDTRYTGSHRLLKEGAHVITSQEDIFDIFPGLQAPTRNNQNQKQPILLPKDTQKILEFIRAHKEVCIEDLLLEFRNIDTVQTKILQLEQQNYVQRLPGNYLLSIE